VERWKVFGLEGLVDLAVQAVGEEAALMATAQSHNVEDLQAMGTGNNGSQK
jgi:hypothetical protein